VGNRLYGGGSSDIVSDSIDVVGDSIDIVGDWRSVIVASKINMDGVDVRASLVGFYSQACWLVLI
jgi:hypothetical protein